MPGGLSVEAENLIRRLLQHDPISRPTLNDIARDPFLQPIVKSKNNLVQSYDSGFGKTFQTASSGATNFLRRSYGDSGVSSVPLKANHKLGNILEENSHSIRKLETLDDSVIEMSTKNEQPIQFFKRKNILDNQILFFLKKFLMGRRMASMENLHIRQLSEPARSPIKKSSAPLAIPPLNLGVSQSFHKEPADELTRPLSCKRLRPEQNKGSTSRSTLLPNNEGAVLEVLNKKRLISQVLYVTGDGMMVTIGTPKLKVPLEGSETPVSRDQLTSVQRYSFDSLPAKYYKKYKHLRCLFFCRKKIKTNFMNF